jgi:hypothetical protein
VALFSKVFFGNKDKTTEDEDYVKGLRCLQKRDFYGANVCFKIAAERAHVSAIYNLSLIHSMGMISPYEIDFGIACFRLAGALGHPNAKEFLEWLDKAEDTSFGTIALSMFAAKVSAQNEPNHLLMMVGCKLYNALCIQYDAVDSVIEYELDAASRSENYYIHNYIKRTGISHSVYSGGLNRIQEGSAADEITDGLNSLYLGLKRSGHSNELCLLIRCTIVGYIISKSRHASRARSLLGADKFFQQ